MLLVHPGARWAVADVEAGIRYGLAQQGVEVVRYRLDHHIACHAMAAVDSAEILRRSSLSAVSVARTAGVDAVIVVAATLFHPDALLALRSQGLRTYVVFTESPYNHTEEQRVAGLVDGCWTHERTSVAPLGAWYLPHAVRPHHRTSGGAECPAHDVVFVGAGFPERISFLNAIDWTGIDLGLYGIWEGFGLRDDLEPCIQTGPIDNTRAAALYRRARVGLNLYRRTPGPAESLNPRAYELAACGAYSVSAHRQESVEKFGADVPTFTTPQEAEALIRRALAHPDERTACAARLPGYVQADTWATRAASMVRDLGMVQAPPCAMAEDGPVATCVPVRLTPWPAPTGGWQ